MSKEKKSLKDKFKKEGKGAKSPSNFDDYLDLSKCKNYKLEKVKLEKGKDYLFGILPFTTKTSKCLVQCDSKMVYNNPDETTYHMLLFVHTFLQYNSGSYICMKETYGKKCPICDYYNRLKNDDHEYEDIKHLRPKLRAIYLVKDTDDKIKLFDVSNYYFEEKWTPIIEKKEKRGEDFYPVYMNEDWARYIDFSVKENSKYNELEAFDFPKIKDYDDKFENHGIHLDDLLVFPDIDKLQSDIDNIGEFNPDDNNEEQEEKEDYDNYLEDANEIDNEDEEQEKPERKVKKEKKIKKDSCPYDCNFGIDWDEYKNCDECEEKHNEIYEKCKELSKEKE